MSNAIDIKLVGGPVNGRVVNMPIGNMPSMIETGIEIYGSVIYLHGKRLIAGKWYRFGYPQGAVEPTDAAILAADIQPAWDLNR